MSIAAIYQMASTANVLEMHSTLLRLGLNWPEFIEDHVRPDLDWGVRDVLVHLPFGKDTVADPFMSFDSYIHAQERDLDDLTRRFSRPWSKVVEGRYTNDEPVRVICYLGSLKHDPDFIVELADPRRLDNWLHRAWRSTRAILDGRCEIAFDTAGTWTQDEPAHWFVGQIRAMGAGGWIEGTERVVNPDGSPATFNGHWRGFPVTANHGHYWRNIHDNRVRWDDPAIYGEKMLMITGHSRPPGQDMSTYHEWAKLMVRRNETAGYSSAVKVSLFRAAGVTMEELVG